MANSADWLAGIGAALQTGGLLGLDIAKNKEKVAAEQQRIGLQQETIQISRENLELARQEAARRHDEAKQLLEFRLKQLQPDSYRQFNLEQENPDYRAAMQSARQSALTKPEGKPFEATDKDGNRVLVQRNADGSLTPVEGFGPAAKSGGISLTTPDGSTVQIGGPQNGGSSELSNPTVNKLQESMVNYQGGLDRLRSIREKAAPGFLTYQGKIDAALLNAKDKAQLFGMRPFGALDEKDKDFLVGYTQFKSDTTNNLNRYIKEITGAAMTQAEAERIMSAAPTLDDGPTTFTAKLDSTVNQLSKAMARAHWTLKNGVSVDSIPLENMDQVVQEYGNKVESQIRASNPDMPADEVEKLAISQVRRAFGM